MTTGWRVSSYCNTGGCVMVAPTPTGVIITDGCGVTLRVTRQDWVGVLITAKTWPLSAS